MKRLLGRAALAVAVLMMVSSVAMAWDFNDHVKIAPNLKGDVLIFPVYAAAPVSGNSGWETKFTVINTATDRSVVAKVVFRSAIFSQELLDFFIYLTPTDVWTGTIRFNILLNRVEVFSDDDSCLSSAGVWASTTAFTAPLANLACTADMSQLGYVEVFESAHTVANAAYPVPGSATNVNLNIPPVNKLALWNAYQNWTTDGPPAVRNVVLVNDNINVLTGIMEIRNTGNNLKAALPATTLRDYNATGNPANTAVLNVINETVFGENLAENTVGEVEATLAKNDLAMYYSDRTLTLHFFTFPTKYARRAVTNAPTCTTFGAFWSPFFTQKSTGGCIQYGAVNYDLRENSSMATNIVSPSTTAQMCQEVNWLSNFAFAEGWARYTFNYPTATTFDVMSATAPYNIGNDGSYTGAPVIGTIVNIGYAADNTLIPTTMLPAAYTDGQVRDMVAPLVAPNVGPGTTYYYYQYQDEANTGFLYDANLPPAADQTRTPRPDGHHPVNNP